jgi:hypothetical protein
VGLGPRVIDWVIVFGGDGEAHYRGRRFAFSALRDQHASRMACGSGPPCHRLGCFGARRARFSAASRGASGRVCLEKGIHPACSSYAFAFSPNCCALSPTSPPRPFAITLFCFPPS